MDENTWQVIQMIMWVAGLQATVLVAIFGAFWAIINRKLDNMQQQIDKNQKQADDKIDKNQMNFNEKLEKLEDKIDKINEKLIDLDRRVFGIEAILHMKDCCVLKEDHQAKRAE